MRVQTLATASIAMLTALMLAGPSASAAGCGSQILLPTSSGGAAVRLNQHVSAPGDMNTYNVRLQAGQSLIVEVVQTSAFGDLWYHNIKQDCSLSSSTGGYVVAGFKYLLGAEEDGFYHFAVRAGSGGGGSYDVLVQVA